MHDAVMIQYAPRIAFHNLTQFPEMNIHVATDDAELRAAAYLRAAAFYQYPSDRSQFAMRVR